MSIVKRISRLLGLQISVESTFGKGSVFSINVPLAKSNTPQLEMNKSAANYASVKQLSSLNVLCVDNDHAVLEAMRTLIDGWGCKVTCVSSYQQGIESLSSHEFDVVLADYRLDDEETGLDLLHVVSERNESEECKKVIEGVLITAEQNTDLKKQAKTIGFHYLSKPIEPASLKSLLIYFLT